MFTLFHKSIFASYINRVVNSTKTYFMRNLFLLFIIFTMFLADRAYGQKERLYNVGQQTLELKDSIRNRPLKTEIWYPTKDSLSKKYHKTESPYFHKPTIRNASNTIQKFPLIMLSHGTGGNRISLMWLAHELAKNGFIVAAVDHWGNTFDNKIPLNFVKVWDRPLDVSYVISSLITDSTFSNNIDINKIGVVGFSLGGYTSIALGGGGIDYNLLKEFSNTEQGQKELNVPELGNLSPLITKEVIKKGNSKNKHLKDERISVFIAMAPAIGQGFKYSLQFENFNSPLLIIGAQNDERTPILTNAKHYHNLIPSSEFIELEGKVGHYVFLNAAKQDLQNNLPLYFKDHETIDRKFIHQKVAHFVVAFLKKNLKY
tara:strand:+ start:1985 stop:3103 length:1119 start_codon:yes stop_codon:yes gene_type:complete